jgi:hypothetical protein
MTNLPKPGERVKDRQVIWTYDSGTIVFGKREGDSHNCGAWVTSVEEWYQYKFTDQPLTRDI